MAKTKTVRLSDEELAVIQSFRAQQKASDPAPATGLELVATDAQKALADAFVSAIERTRPPSKKTVFDRKVNTPWTPANGETQLKLKRKMYHHGVEITRVNNADIALLNQIKPGHYCDGYVRVTLRKDRSLDIDYPVRTASNRLKMVNQYGVRSFTELLQRLVEEKANPTKYRKPEDSDLYDLE